MISGEENELMALLILSGYPSYKSDMDRTKYPIGVYEADETFEVRLCLLPDQLFLTDSHFKT